MELFKILNKTKINKVQSFSFQTQQKQVDPQTVDVILK